MLSPNTFFPPSYKKTLQCLKAILLNGCCEKSKSRWCNWLQFIEELLVQDLQLYIGQLKVFLLLDVLVFPYNRLASATHYIKVGGKGQSLLYKVKDGNKYNTKPQFPQSIPDNVGEKIILKDLINQYKAFERQINKFDQQMLEKGSADMNFHWWNRNTVFVVYNSCL